MTCRERLANCFENSQGRGGIIHLDETLEAQLL